MPRNVEIKLNSSMENDPYLLAIATMAQMEFPNSVRRDPCAVFEAIVLELIGTKQTRYGPTPTPEALVAIRQIVRQAVAKDQPIPVLVPWGSSKQGPWTVDIAEVMALKQLHSLHERVATHYAPGVSGRIRLEDLTDRAMFSGVPGWGDKIGKYTETFGSLQRILAPAFPHLLESSLMNVLGFRDHVDAQTPDLVRAIQMPQGQRGAFLKQRLHQWQGELPDNQLNFYRKAYEKFYPGEPQEGRDIRLAKYFASSISRVQLKGTGADGWDEGFITLAFTDTPWGRNGSRLFYRTIPERYTNQHRAPWIGKGYVRITGREAIPRIAGWDGDDLDFVPASMTLQSGELSAIVATDYVVADYAEDKRPRHPWYNGD